MLDNLEQVTEAAPEIAVLLDSCPNLHILATSREPLRIGGEQEFPLAPLALPGAPGGAIDEETEALSPAVALFVDRARNFRPGFAVTERNVSTIVEICQRLDGLPLAIELAAAWCRVLTPEALLIRLSSRLDILRGGHRTLPERQKTMRAAIDWSYELLDADQRAVFRSLAVFRGGWSLEAAEAVAPADVDILDTISALVERSLVQSVGDDTGETSFRMLETVREFAGERLTASGEEDAIRSAHAAFVLRWAERLAHAPGAETWNQLERDHANVRTALEWLHAHADAADELRLVAAMSQFWYAHSNLREGSAWLESSLARSGSVASIARARALLGLGVLTHYLGDDTKAERVLREALVLGRELDDERTTGAALTYLGVLAEDRGAFEQADVMYREAIPLLVDTAQDLAAQTIAHRGIVATGMGDLDAAERFCQEGLELARTAADPIGEFVARNWLANLARERGDLVASAERFVSLLTDIGFSWPGALRERGRAEDASILLPGIAALLVAAGRPEDAAILFGAGTAVRDEVGLALFVPERDLFERAEAAIDAALGVGEAQRLRAAGSRLTPAEYAARAEAALAKIVPGQTAAQPSPIQGDKPDP